MMIGFFFFFCPSASAFALLRRFPRFQPPLRIYIILPGFSRGREKEREGKGEREREKDILTFLPQHC